MILETERLYLRELNQGDFDALCRMLKDPEVMYAYEGAFSDGEAHAWLDRQIRRYRMWGFGLWAVIEKETGALIGQCGLTMQPWRDTEVLEIGYLLCRAYWRRGYAAEAAEPWGPARSAPSSGIPTRPPSGWRCGSGWSAGTAGQSVTGGWTCPTTAMWSAVTGRRRHERNPERDPGGHFGDRGRL